jgi:hypothetical protein
MSSYKDDPAYKRDKIVEYGLMATVYAVYTIIAFIKARK